MEFEVLPWLRVNTLHQNSMIEWNIALATHTQKICENKSTFVIFRNSWILTKEFIVTKRTHPSVPTRQTLEVIKQRLGVEGLDVDVLSIKFQIGFEFFTVYLWMCVTLPESESIGIADNCRCEHIRIGVCRYAPVLRELEPTGTRWYPYVRLEWCRYSHSHASYQLATSYLDVE